MNPDKIHSKFLKAKAGTHDFVTADNSLFKKWYNGKLPEMWKQAILLQYTAIHYTTLHYIKRVVNLKHEFISL